jgi:hypothetical protein
MESTPWAERREQIAAIPSGRMMDMYSTLSRAKQAMNGGDVPPLTPLTRAALKHIDPEFAPGMGVLVEDADKGFRCPVRGCGRYFQKLSVHLDGAHKDIGGSWGVRDLLSLDPHQSMTAPRLRDHCAQRARETRRRWWRRYYDIGCASCGAVGMTGDDLVAKESDNGTLTPLCPHCGNIADLSVEDDDITPFFDRRPLQERLSDEDKARLDAARATREAKAKRDRATSLGLRNLLDLCDTQICVRVLAVKDRVRRWPSAAEVAVHDTQLLGATALLGWEWDHVLAWVRLSTGQSEDKGRDDVLLLIEAWHARNGTLPLERDCTTSCGSPPPMPESHVICKALGVADWNKAMSVAAACLGIRGCRFGLPAAKSA